MSDTANTANARDMRTECWQCVHQTPVAGDRHIGCSKPDRKMVGNAHGVRQGWFFYPLIFDPAWKEKLCDNYEAAT